MSTQQAKYAIIQKFDPLLDGKQEILCEINDLKKNYGNILYSMAYYRCSYNQFFGRMGSGQTLTITF